MCDVTRIRLVAKQHWWWDRGLGPFSETRSRHKLVQFACFADWFVLANTMFILLLFSIRCTRSSQASTWGTWALQHCCQDLTRCFWRITQEYRKWRWHLQHRDRTVWIDIFYFARVGLVLMYWAKGQGKLHLNYAKRTEEEEGWKWSLGDLSALEIMLFSYSGERGIVARNQSRMVLFAVPLKGFIYWLGLSWAVILN